jgi:hypothetical protein
MKRSDIGYRLTKVGGKMASVAMCALTGCIIMSMANMAIATPVVYFQTFVTGETRLQDTVNTYSSSASSTFTTTTVSGLASGSSWNISGIDISATNGASRTIDSTYLSNSPSLIAASGTTGVGINMTASSADPTGSGLTFKFGTLMNSFGIQLGDWGTCCYNSSLYIQFGNQASNSWENAQLIGTATKIADVPEQANGKTTPLLVPSTIQTSSTWFVSTVTVMVMYCMPAEQFTPAL